MDRLLLHVEILRLLKLGHSVKSIHYQLQIPLSTVYRVQSQRHGILTEWEKYRSAIMSIYAIV